MRNDLLGDDHADALRRIDDQWEFARLWGQVVEAWGLKGYVRPRDRPVRPPLPRPPLGMKGLCPICGHDVPMVDGKLATHSPDAHTSAICAGSKRKPLTTAQPSEIHPITGPDGKPVGSWWVTAGAGVGEGP